MMNTSVKALCLALVGLGVSSSSAHAQTRKVYWAQATDDRVLRSDLGGGAVESLVSFPATNGIVDVAVDPVASKILWAQSFESRIRRANFDGSSAQTIVGFPNASGIVAVAVDPFRQKVYWAHTFDDQIKRADFSGANIEVVLAFPVIIDVVDIAIDPIEGKLYWAEALDDKIRRANLDATAIEEIAGFPDVSGVIAIAHDPVTSSVYWAQTFNDRIRRIVIGDVNPLTILEAPVTSAIIDLAVDAVDGKVLWTQADDTVWRADRLGENVLPSLEWPDVDGPLALATETLTVIPPAALLADPSGSDKNRFLSFVVPSGAAAGAAEETAIQIELTTLNHVCSAGSDNLFDPCTTDEDCINGVCERRFIASEGQVRFVNVVKTCQGAAMSTGEVICRGLADCAIDEECLQFRTCDGTTDLCATSDDCPAGVLCLASMTCPDDVFKPPFLCATTGCAPEYRDWAGDLAGGVLHVYGPGIVPAHSEYNLRQIPAACAGNEVNCPSASAALMIATARWADLTADGATNAADITAASDKVKPIHSAFTKPRTMLLHGILNPFRNVNVIELQNTVDAVKSLPMTGSITGPEDCGT